MRDRFETRAAERGLPLGMHFGINTGPVVTGAVGSRERSSFSVMGDAVNLAARLEDLSVTGEILVGPATFENSAEEFDFERREPVLLKGKQEAVPVYRLLGRRTAAPRPRFSAPLVGRAAELKRLQLALDASQGEAGSALVIEAEAGLGKSRLVAEALLSRPQVRRIEVRAQSHEQASGFGGARAAIEQLIALDGGAEETARARLEASLIRHLQSEAEAMVRPISSILGLIPESVYDGRTPHELLHKQISFGLAQWLRSISREALKLEPLTPEGGDQLLRSLAENRPLDAAVTRQLIDRSDGNPFFLEELFQSVDGLSGSLPSTIQGVMMARLDRLPAREKAVAQAAAVLGRTFLTELVETLVDRHGTQDALRQLEAVGILRPRLDAGGEVTSIEFRHALTQEVAYQSLLLSRRRTLHERAAMAIEERGQAGTEHSSILAHHYEKAERTLDAARHLVDAGRAASAAYAIPESLDFYHRITSHAAGLREQGAAGRDYLATAYEETGVLLQLAGQSERALLALRSALALLDGGPSVRRASLLRRCGRAQMLRRDAEPALAEYARAEAELDWDGSGKTHEWWGEWIEIQLDRMWSLSWLGRLREVAALSQSVEARVVQHGNLGQRARLLDRHNILQLFREGSRVSAEVVARCRSALGMAEQFGHFDGLAMTRFTLGFACYWRGDLADAERELFEALRLARFTANAEYEVAAVTFLAATHRARGDVEATASLFESLTIAAESAEMAAYLAVAYSNQAWVELRSDRPSHARLLAQKAVAIWDVTPWRIRWFGEWPLLALALADRDLVRAVHHAGVLLRRDQYAQPVDIEAKLNQALRTFDEGDADAAFQAFGEAARLARMVGMI
jgi:hypothetical protein